MAHEVETMVYVRDVPWHRLGVCVEEAPDSEVALVKAGLLWAVKSEPIYIGSRLADGYRANVRATDDALLGIVSDQYQIVQNREAFAFTDELLGEGVVYETAGSLRGGKRIWLLARMPERYKALDDDIDAYLCFTNSHDGSSAVRVITTPIRVVCNNTLSLALGGAHRSWSGYHTKGVHDRLDDARRTLGLSRHYYETLTKEAEKLGDISVDIDNLVGKLFPFEEDEPSKRVQTNVNARREWLYNALSQPDIKPYEGTAWQFVCAVSDMVTHRPPERVTETWEERRLESVFDGPRLLQEAYALVRR